MKKSFLLFVALFGFITLSFGQDGIKAIKKAGRSLSTYNLDQNANAEKLDAAIALVMENMNAEEVKADSESNTIMGDVLAAQSNRLINAAVFAPESAKGKDFSIANKAVGFYKQAFQTAVKKFQKKDALSGLLKMETIMENMGIIAYQNDEMLDAFESFDGLLDLSEFLVQNDESTIIDSKKKKDLIMNSISVGAIENSGIDITGSLEKAIAMGLDTSTMYQLAYTAFEKTDKEKALKYLNMGIAKYPNDSGLLFAQINNYIAEGKLEALIDKLKEAIKAEPENATVYATLGNVYDQLYGKAVDEGDEVKSEEYFNGALEYYKQATEIDTASFNSYYGMGALYFNKAAKVGKELNALSSDFSAAGIKKYDEKKAEMTGYYESSFPFLEAAEKIDAKDPLVIQALKEYYVRTGNNDKAAEYKAKLDAISAGN